MGLTELLGGIPHFAHLSPTNIEALANTLVERDYAAGHVFTREGERDATIFLVVEGEVSVTGVRNGHEHQLNQLGPGELFGLVSLVDDGPRSATCRAAGPCRVATLQASAVTLLFNQAAPISCAFQKALAAQLAHDFRHLLDRLNQLGGTGSETPAPGSSS